MDALTLNIRVKRHKGGTWYVHINWPDGSYTTHRGLVDHWHAVTYIQEAIYKLQAQSGEAP